MPLYSSYLSGSTGAEITGSIAVSGSLSHSTYSSSGSYVSGSEGTTETSGSTTTSSGSFGYSMTSPTGSYWSGSHGVTEVSGGHIVITGSSPALSLYSGDLTVYSGNAVFNESSGDYDFRVESNSQTHMLFVDASTDRVGIGTATPGATLDVLNGHTILTDTDVVHGCTNVAPTNAYGDFGPIHATLGGLMINGISDQESADARSLALRGISNDSHTDTVPLVEIIGAKRSGTSVQALAAAETVLQVANHTTTLATVLGSGNVGIGVTDPDTALEVFKAGTQLKLSYNASDNATFAVDDNGDLTIDPSGDTVVITGNLTVNGTTTTVNTTNSVLTDSLIKLNNGATSNTNDCGILIERGSTGNNAIVAWDESADGFIVGTTTADGDATGNLTIAAAPFQASTIAGTTITTTGAIELGHASDTTIARASSGQITVEGAAVVLAGAVTGITSLLATDIKIGEDDQTKIDFEIADEIHFYAANVEQVYLADNIFGPQSDSDVDLGTTGVRWKDAYIDTVTTTGTITASGIIKTEDTTAATSTTNGSLQTDGGLSVVLDAVIGDDLILLSDASVIHFGADSEVTLTHVHDVGLTLTHTAIGDNLPVVLQLKSEEDAIIANEVIASLEFAAGDSDGTDGATVAAGIHAIAEGAFSATANATKLVFTTGVSETAASSATAKATLSSIGDFEVAGDLVIKDTGTLGPTSDKDAMSFASDGIVTFSQTPVLSGASISANTVPFTALADLARGSVLIGNASAATTELTIGSNGYMLTSDGTDIAWAASAGMTAFILEDDGGAEVSVSNNEEIKFIGSGITTSWTDTTPGSDADPFDLTFTVDAAQTGITSVYNASLKMGRDTDNLIDFAIDNQITFRVGAADEITLAANNFSPTTADGIALGSTSKEWSDLYLADAGVVYFGNDQEVTLTHVHNKGLTLSSSIAGMPEFGLLNTNNDGAGARLFFDKNGANAADNDVLGVIDWLGENDAASPETIIYGHIECSSMDVSDGSEDGIIRINTMVAGTTTELMSLGNGMVTINGPVGTGEATAAVLEMNTIEQTIVDGDVLGRIEFKAVLEGSGTDAILTGAAIQAEASDTFAADNNSTDLVFKTAASAAASEKMRLDSGTPKLTIGSAAEEDTMLAFDGNAQDYRVGLNDTTDNLEIGVGTTHGTTPALTINSSTDIEVYGSVSINTAIADTKVSGITAVFTAGEILKQGEVCYFKPGDSRMWKALATAVATSRCVAMATEDLSAGGVGKFLLQGFLKCAANFPSYTVGSTLYTPEAETANDAASDNNAVPEQVAPDTTGDFVQIIGWVYAADTVYFNPSSTVIEVA